MIDGDCGRNTLGEQMCFFNGTYTGSSCSGSEASQGTSPQAGGDTPEYDCIKQGKSYGTVNGVVVCVAAGTSGSAPTTSYEPASSTSSSSTSTDSTGATSTSSSDSTGTKVVSFNSDGTVTEQTTNSTMNSDGTSTQTAQEKTQTKEDYCALNPASTNCKQQTQCEENPEGPTCKHFCEKFPDSVACINAEDYIGNVSNEVGDGWALLVEKAPVPESLTKVEFPSNAGCPAPESMSLFGQSITLSYNWLCDYASSFKPLVILFSMLSALYIVMGSIKREQS
jgi:hypothetical protein